MNLSPRSKAQGELLRVVAAVTTDVPDRDLHRSEGLRLLVERLADRFLPLDALAKARLRGILVMRELLAGDGGALSASDVAKTLGISRQAVDKRRQAGQLLAIEMPKRGWLYPAWQFKKTGTVLEGVPEVLQALAEHDPWAQVRFFVSGNDRLGGKRPVDLLARGQNLDKLLLAAAAFEEQGAA
jgi:hypothetical protein